jgi:hypothetical protein
MTSVDSCGGICNATFDFVTFIVVSSVRISLFFNSHHVGLSRLIVVACVPNQYLSDLVRIEIVPNLGTRIRYLLIGFAANVSLAR